MINKRLERKEVETHSRFIYELLNPKGRHGQGNIFLKSFAKIVLSSDVSESAIDPQREDLTAENKRIDFTLETEKNIFGIEMKIDVDDQQNQLFDYNVELKKRAKGKTKGIKLFYLSLDGKEASDDSLKSSIKNSEDLTKENYKCISFATEILNWINDCIRQSAEKSVLREALIQYKILIEKLTEQDKDMNTETATLIGKSTENLRTSLAIEKSLLEAKAQFQVKFWEDLRTELGDEDFGFYDAGGEEADIYDMCEKYCTKTKNNKIYGICPHKDEKIEIVILVKDSVYFWIDEDEKTIPNLNFKTFNSDLVDMLSGEERTKTIALLADEFKALIKRLN
jgi:hypothetical protein